MEKIEWRLYWSTKNCLKVSESGTDYLAASADKLLIKSVVEREKNKRQDITVTTIINTSFHEDINNDNQDKTITSVPEGHRMKLKAGEEKWKILEVHTRQIWK